MGKIELGFWSSSEPPPWFSYSQELHFDFKKNREEEYVLKLQAPVVRRLDNRIHRRNLYPVDTYGRPSQPKIQLRLIKAWVKNDFRLQCPPSKVRGIRVDCASNHSYLESRSRSSWTASAILKCRLCIGFPIFAGEFDNVEENIKRR